MKPYLLAALGLIASAASWIPAQAADGAAGQKTFTTACAGCHQLKSYGSKSDAELQTDLKGIVAGTVKHPKKLTLSPTDIDNVAAYISATSRSDDCHHQGMTCTREYWFRSMAVRHR